MIFFLDNTTHKIVKRTPNHIISLSKTSVNSSNGTDLYIDFVHSFINNDKRYILRYHCEEMMYKKYLTDFEMMTDSFKFKATPL